MSQGKIWTIVIIAIVVIAGGWMWFANSSGSSNTAAVPPVQNNVVQEQQTTNQPVSEPTGASASTDTSNAALEQDMNAVDNQINNINTDNSNAAAGLNSSPTPTAQ